MGMFGEAVTLGADDAEFLVETAEGAAVGLEAKPALVTRKRNHLDDAGVRMGVAHLEDVELVGEREAGEFAGASHKE